MAEAGPKHLYSKSRTVRCIDIRWIRKVLKTVSFEQMERTSLDSHADTCCGGSNTVALTLTGEKVNVFPFSDNLPAVQEVPIATILTIWESPKTGEPWMLVIHEALYFGDRLKESLLCPNQLRAAGVLVQDTPIQFDSTSAHSLTIPGKLELPLEMHGVISHLRTRRPTADEVERYQAGLLQSVELTKDVPWEPYSEQFAETEAAARAARSVTAPRVTVPRPMRNHTQSSDEEEEVSPQRPPILTDRCIAVAHRLTQSQATVELLDDEDLASQLVAAVNIESDARNGDGLDERSDDPICNTSKEDRAIFALSSTERGPVITKEILARRWGIGLNTAHRTLPVMTQFGIRHVLHPVERRYKTCQSHLCFPTLILSQSLVLLIVLCTAIVLCLLL